MTHSDNGNGTFSNPLIHGDFPDPDIIRVGSDFYMVSSTFTCAPGIPVCHSRDLLHWSVIGHAYDRLPASNPAYSMRDGLAAYRGGSWAPFIRHRAGKFYIGFNTPAEGFFMAVADRPEGPYALTPFGVELYDPSLLFDDDGRVYLAHGANGIFVTELSPDALAVASPPALVFQTPVGTPLEGSHFIKRNGFYYLCLTSRGYNGMQVVLRANRPLGPYALRLLSADDLNYANAGAHQGGFVDLPNGDTWFFMFQDRDYLGRAPVLFPARWEDDWPVLGDPDNFGKLPVTCPLPALPAHPAPPLEASDDFDSPALGLAWHWNHNPDDSRWSLAERPGWLRLKAAPAPSFDRARNTAMRKILGPSTHATTLLDASALAPGDIAGLAIANLPYAFIGVRRLADSSLEVAMVDDGKTIAARVLPQPLVHLRADVGSDGLARFAFGFGETMEPLGDPFVMRFTVKTFLGNRFGLFCYHEGDGPSGHADFDHLHLPLPRPAHRFSAFEEIPAAAYDAEYGTDTQRLEEKMPAQYLTNLNDGDWARYDQIDFTEGASRFEVRAVPCLHAGTIEVRLSRPDGPLLGSCPIPGGIDSAYTAPPSDFSAPVTPARGLQTVCLRFTGHPTHLFRLSSFRFSNAS